MPEYLAPGVFIEEVSYRAKSIEGVSTTTTGFVGPTRYGPVDIEPDILTSMVEFERVYGGRQQLEFVNTGMVDNYMWNAARAFFEEGGKRLYVARTFPGGPVQWNAACAKVVGAVPPANVAISARFPGKCGESKVKLQFSTGPNRIAFEGPVAAPTQALLRACAHLDVVFVDRIDPPAAPPVPDPQPLGPRTGLYLLTRDAQQDTWTFTNGATSFELQTLIAFPNAIVRTVTATVFVEPTGPGLPFFAATGLALDRGHRSAGKPDSIFDYFAEKPESLSASRTIPIIIRTLTEEEAEDERDAAQAAADAAAVIDLAREETRSDAEDARDAAQLAIDNAAPGTDLVPLQIILTAAEAALLSATAAQAQSEAALDVANAELVAANARLAAAAANANRSGLQVASDYLVGATTPNRFTLAALAANKGDSPFMDADFFLTNGSDGTLPGPTDYEGAENVTTNQKWGLKSFEDIEDISIVAAPGSSFVDTNAQAIANAVISHAERMRYRIAVIDSVRNASIAQVREYRGKFDSKYAAFYYPWVRIVDPETSVENVYPPSGFVSGIYARNDIERAVYKAPANEVVRLALGFEKFLNKAQQEVLNPEGVNCFRFFEGRGMRLWGARTMTSDPEWKYVNLRRYFAYLERSIDKGTQWAVFEPNGEKLWANVRRTIEDFLLNEWQNGALLGEKPEKAYFVKCDRSTMTQNDLDNGRLICQVGVAALRPAEFVIFRIGQWTADRKA